MPAFTGVALVNAIIESAGSLASNPSVAQRDSHDLTSILSLVADDPSVAADNDRLLDTVDALLTGVTSGGRSENQTVEDALDSIAEPPTCSTRSSTSSYPRPSPARF